MNTGKFSDMNMASVFKLMNNGVMVVNKYVCLLGGRC